MTAREEWVENRYCTECQRTTTHVVRGKDVVCDVCGRKRQRAEDVK